MQDIQVTQQNESRTENQAIVSSRLRFFEKYSDWNWSDWKTVIFSDESYFEVFSRKERSYVRRLPSESDKPFCFPPRVQVCDGSISVWGVMIAKGIGPLAFMMVEWMPKIILMLLKIKCYLILEKCFDESDLWYVRSGICFFMTNNMYVWIFFTSNFYFFKNGMNNN